MDMLQRKNQANYTDQTNKQKKVKEKTEQKYSGGLI